MDPRATLIAICLLAGVAVSLAVPAKREAPAEGGEGQPKITYSKATVTTLGEETKLDCAVVGVDLTDVEEFGVSWSKIDEEKPTNSFPISANDKVLLFSNKYTIDHPEASYQYSLVIKEVSEDDVGLYRCTVNFGNEQKINAEVPLNIERSPYFTDNFTKSLSVTEGDAISIDCQPGGWPKPEVYWERLNDDLPYYGGKFFKSNQFDIPLIARDHTGHYVCYADNGVGDPATSHIILEVQFPPDVDVEKSFVYAGPSEEVSMKCTVDAYPEADVAWYKDDQPILGAANMKVSRVEEEGGKRVTTTLTIFETEAETYGTYYCRGVNVAGQNEQSVELKTKSPPLIVKQSRSEVLYDLEKTLGRDAIPVVIECEASGHPEPEFRWTKDGAQLVWQSDPRFSLEPGTGNLLISDLTMADNGMYQCYAYNDLGTAVSDPVYLLNTSRIQYTHEHTESDTYNVEAELGRPFHLQCPKASAYPEPKLDWVKAIQGEGQVQLEFVNDERVVADAEGNLWFAYVTEEDATGSAFKYMCLGSTEFEPTDYSIASIIELSVTDPADGTLNAANDALNVETFTMHTSPESVSFFAGEENTLWCIFGGEPSPSVQWRRTDGQELDETRFATRNHGRTLVFKDTMVSDAAEYECTASNDVGEAKNAMMTVDVVQKPTFKEPMASQTVNAGATVTFTCDAEASGDVIYNWTFNGRVVAKDSSRRKITQNQLIIERVTMTDIGNYACNVTSDIGYAYGQAVLNVIPTGERHAASGSCDNVATLRNEVNVLSEAVKEMKVMIEATFAITQHNQGRLSDIASMLMPMVEASEAAEASEAPEASEAVTTFASISA